MSEFFKQAAAELRQLSSDMRKHTVISNLQTEGVIAGEQVEYYQNKFANVTEEAATLAADVLKTAHSSVGKSASFGKAVSSGSEGVSANDLGDRFINHDADFISLDFGGY